MAGESGARCVRRIVVGLDESEGSHKALEEAARLAHALRVELIGLFIEDVTYLRAAALPVTRALGVSARGPQEMAPDLMERAFRVHADRLRKRFTEASMRWGLRATFQTARGEIADQIQATLSEGDLVALGRTGWRQSNRRMIGSTAATMIEHATCPVLLFAGRLRSDLPVLAVYEGSERVLELAADLAGCFDLGLHILVLGNGNKDSLQNQAQRWRDERGHSASITTAEGPNDNDKFEAVSAQPAAIAVVDAQGVVVQRSGLRNLMPHIDGPVLVVR